MIETSKLWYKEFLGDAALSFETLRGLDVVVARALASDPSRAEPAVMDAGAKIIGAVAFGRGCIVGHGALIVGPAIFGDNCVIGHASEVTRSMFGDDSRAAHFNYVGDSIVGSHVNLGAGAKLANTRFDKKEIFGLPHCGAILGDNVQIGCNAVVDPGVVVGDGVWFAGVHLPVTADGSAHTRESVKKYFY